MGKVNERIKTLIAAGNLTTLSEVLDEAKLTNIAKSTPIHYNTLVKYKKLPGTIKTEVYIILSEYFEIEPDELFRLALKEIGYKSPKSK